MQTFQQRFDQLQRDFAFIYKKQCSADLTKADDSLRGIVVRGNYDHDPRNHNNIIYLLFNDDRAFNVLKEKAIKRGQRIETSQGSIAPPLQKPVYEAAIHCNFTHPEGMREKLSDILKILTDAGLIKQGTIEEAYRQLDLGSPNMPLLDRFSVPGGSR